MRIFKEGNIQSVLFFSYSQENSGKKIFSTLTGVAKTIIRHEYSLEDSEIDNLEDFLKGFNLNIRDKSLNLALENYELAYEVENVKLQFLTLMNALEVLLKSGKEDLSHKLSRNGAILLGEDKESSNEIFRSLKCYYNIRSQIVHTGKPKECKKNAKPLNEEQMVEYTSILRNYVMESIKEMNYIIQSTDKKNKSEILMLNECGFGERPWKKEMN